jgi:CPA2 family monovalent cation:H+ antiporter-2
MPDMDLRSLRVHESSPLAGKTIGEAKLGSRYGVTVLAVRRDAEIFSIPKTELELRPEDILFLVGPPEKITELETVLRGEG